MLLVLFELRNFASCFVKLTAVVSLRSRRIVLTDNIVIIQLYMQRSSVA